MIPNEQKQIRNKGGEKKVFDEINWCLRNTGYRFKNATLLKNALTRTGAQGKNDQPDHFQRMEFLGDRVLNCIALELALEVLPKGSPVGVLNNAKESFVNNHSLVKIAGRFNLKKAIKLAKGEVLSPGILADSVEVLLGAIFLDNASFEPCKKLLRPLFTEQLKSFNLIIEMQNRPPFPTSLLMPFQTSQNRAVSSSAVQIDDERFEQATYKFRKKVLHFDLEKISEKLDGLKWVKSQLKEKTWLETLKENYYLSQKHLLFEEARAVVQNAYESFQNKKTSESILDYVSGRVATNPDNPSFVTLEGKVKVSMDMGCSTLICFLRPQGQQEIFYGLGDYSERELGQEENSDKKKRVTIRFVLPQLEPTTFIELFDSETKWELHIAGSLLNVMRMYEVCHNRPEFKLLPFIVSGQIDKSITPSQSLLQRVDHQLLNPSQNQAINDFMQIESGLLCWQGPPGTGKTTTIIHLMQRLSESPGQTLITAPSNKAIQVIAERFIKDYPDVLVILAGVESKLPENLRGIFLHTFGGDLIRSVRQIIQNLFKILESQDKKETMPLMGGIAKHFLGFEQAIYRFLPVYAKQWDLEAIRKTLMQLSTESISDKELGLEWLNLLIRKFQEISNDLEVGNQSSKANPTTTIESILLKNAKFVFATLSVCGRKSMAAIEPDNVIIDEGSQATESEALIALSKNPKRALIVGDPKQLPACMISTENRCIGYDKSLMYRLLEVEKQRFSLLNVQYRMHPKISFFSNVTFYQGQIKDAPENEKQSEALVKKIGPVAPYNFVNVQGNELLDSASYSNPEEVEAIVDFLSHLKNRQGIDVAQSVGVITFYSAQVRLLQDRLNYKKSLGSVKVSTVDGFQGDERDIILISFVRANEKGSLGFIKELERLNVSITRARSCLIMFGNQKTLGKKKSVILDMLSHMGEQKLIISREQFESSYRNNKSTTPCLYLIKGKCYKGSGCNYSHDLDLKEKRNENQFSSSPRMQQALTRESAIQEKLALASSYSQDTLRLLGDAVIKLGLALIGYIENPRYIEKQLHDHEQEHFTKEKYYLDLAKHYQLEKRLIRGEGERELNSSICIDTCKAIFGAQYLDALENQYGLLKSATLEFLGIQPEVKQLPNKSKAQGSANRNPSNRNHSSTGTMMRSMSESGQPSKGGQLIKRVPSANSPKDFQLPHQTQSAKPTRRKYKKNDLGSQNSGPKNTDSKNGIGEEEKRWWLRKG